MLRPGGHFLKLTAALCLLSLFTTGCWDNREPEWLASSLLLAFDLEEKDGGKMYTAIVVLANPLFQSGGEGGSAGSGGAKMPFWVHTAQGRTPFEAVLNLSQGTTRQIRFSHTMVLLFSEKLARDGIWPVLEFFQRHRELRTTVQTAVVDGDLEELLRTEFPLELLPSTAVDRLIRITGIERSIIPDSQLLEKLIEFTRPGEEMILARIKALPQKAGGEPQDDQQGKGEQGKEQQGGNQQDRRNQQGQGQHGQTPPGPPAEVIGAAAFHGDKMAGWMDGHETRGQNWVRNTLERGVIVVELPGKNGLATIEIIRMDSKIKPRINDGEVMITVDITAEGRIQDLVVSPEEIPRIDKSLDQDLENRFAEAIRRDCERALTRAKELNADIFGFGNAVYRKHPRLWEKELAGRWDEIFPRLSVEFLVEAPIKRSGMILTSPPHQ